MDITILTFTEPYKLWIMIYGDDNAITYFLNTIFFYRLFD